MSKIGKKPIIIPSDVQISIANNLVSVKGPKGELSLTIHPKVLITTAEDQIKVAVKNPEDSRQRAIWGTYRALVNNIVAGVTQGFEKKLEIVGVGYKVAVTGGKLILNIGFSHPIEMPIPAGLEVKAEKNVITISGIDRQLVGQFSALIRKQREPEPYKGKGIKYSDEVIRRKAGKVVKAVGVG